MDFGFQALWHPFWRVLTFVGTAIAIRDMPYISSGFTKTDWLLLFTPLLYLVECVVSLSAALVISRWLFGRGPLGALSSYKAAMRSSNV